MTLIHITEFHSILINSQQAPRRSKMFDSYNPIQISIKTPLGVNRILLCGRLPGVSPGRRENHVAALSRLR